MTEITLETITPEKAQEYLATKERTLRNSPNLPNIVASYTQDMKNGQWKLTASPIRFEAGHLVDGRLRLLAVIKAGIPVEMVVARIDDPKRTITGE